MAVGRVGTGGSDAVGLVLRQGKIIVASNLTVAAGIDKAIGSQGQGIDPVFASHLNGDNALSGRAKAGVERAAFGQANQDKVAVAVALIGEVMDDSRPG